MWKNSWNVVQTWMCKAGLDKAEKEESACTYSLYLDLQVFARKMSQNLSISRMVTDGQAESNERLFPQWIMVSFETFSFRISLTFFCLISWFLQGCRTLMHCSVSASQSWLHLISPTFQQWMQSEYTMWLIDELSEAVCSQPQYPTKSTCMYWVRFTETYIVSNQEQSLTTSVELTA